MTDAALNIWTASPRAFGLRCLGLFVVTNALLFPGWPFIGGLNAFLCALMLSLVYMFVLDDFTDWLAHRKATWTLTATTLTYNNPSEDLGTHNLPLSDVKTAKARFWWSIVLRLSNGQAVTMRYIDKPAQACKLIRTTKEAMA